MAHQKGLGGIVAEDVSGSVAPKPKSILDGVPVVEKGFDACGFPVLSVTTEEPRVVWKVVGNCAVCGCPIYGPETVPEGEAPPRVMRACTCNHWHGWTK